MPINLRGKLDLNMASPSNDAYRFNNQLFKWYRQRDYNGVQRILSLPAIGQTTSPRRTFVSGPDGTRTKYWKEGGVIKYQTGGVNNITGNNIPGDWWWNNIGENVYNQVLQDLQSKKLNQFVNLCIYCQYYTPSTYLCKAYFDAEPH